jgi:hypothetical protein
MIPARLPKCAIRIAHPRLGCCSSRLVDSHLAAGQSIMRKVVRTLLGPSVLTVECVHKGIQNGHHLAFSLSSIDLHGLRRYRATKRRMARATFMAILRSFFETLRLIATGKKRFRLA